MIHVGQGRTVGALTVFPIWQDRTSTGARRYTTGGADLVLGESPGGPVVGQLHVDNRGQLPALVLDGQLFEGGWQHRMATRSAMVAAGGSAPIDVACVEQRRWGGVSGQMTRGRRASTYVRNGFDAGQQHEVWRRVEQHGLASPSGSLVSRLDVRDTHAELVLERTRPLPGQTGILVGIGGHPISLEVFDHPQTLVEQLPQIVRAASLDAYGRPALPTPGRRARRMVARLERARLDLEPDVGQTARLGRARTEALDVMSLRYRHRVVHLRAIDHRHPVLVAS